MNFPENNPVRNYQENQSVQPGLGHKGQGLAKQQQTPLSLIQEEISLPAAVIKHSSLKNNLDWMQTFADHHHVSLCPHGKTTMTPAFFQQQIEQGAWGITIATVAQAEIAALAGVNNIIMANQLVGKANMALVANLIRNNDVEFYCCVDSALNLAALDEFFTQQQVTLNVLIELGVDGGRCGCRSDEEVIELAEMIESMSHINLAGIEVYEGVIHGENEEQEVRDFLQKTLSLAQYMAMNKLVSGKPIVTGAGSAWYDIVAHSFANLTHAHAIIRPGCYAIHDTGIYLEAQEKVLKRATSNQGYACEMNGDLESALEVWAYVISRPEPTKLVVGMGKRDVAFDAGLPIAERAYSNGKSISVSGLTSVAVMDQHTFVEVEADNSINVGDMIAFSTSHPCLTFDKWRYIAICDDDYHVTRWVETCF